MWILVSVYIDILTEVLMNNLVEDIFVGLNSPVDSRVGIDDDEKVEYEVLDEIRCGYGRTVD